MHNAHVVDQYVSDAWSPSSPIVTLNHKSRVSNRGCDVIRASPTHAQYKWSCHVYMYLDLLEMPHAMQLVAVRVWL